MRRAAVVVAIAVGSASCGVFVAFDDYDTSPSRGSAAEAGAGAETSSAGFHLEATPSTLVLSRDVPATISVHAVRDPGFVDAIAFDAPTHSSTAFTSSADAGGPVDTLVAHVVGTVAGPAGKITFSAHSPGRSQSLDVDVSVTPSSGDPDPSFANGGVTLAEDSAPFGVVIDDTGRVIVGVTRTIPGGNEQVLHAWNAAGLRETSFGDAGDTTLVQVNGFNGTDGYDLAITPAGVIATTDDAVQRVTPNGQLDPTFGDAGVARTLIFASIVATEGKSTTTLGTYVAQTENLAQRFNGDGTLDGSWGDAGTVDLGSSENVTFVPTCARVLGGKLLFVNASLPTAANAHPEIVRLTSNGARDPTWGDGGSHALPANPVVACEITATGTVVLAGSGLLVRSNGTSDATSAATFVEEVTDVAIDSIGRVVVAGSSANSTQARVARYLPDGTPDNAFHSGGLTFGVALPYAGSDVHVALTANDGVIATVNGGTPNVLFVTRLLP